MTATGIKVAEEELEQVLTAQKCSGMFLSGGQPMGDPQAIVERLSRKYNAPEGSGLNTQDGQFYLP
jgi:hypothetical protein